jgi:hypothetical protein
MRLIRNLFDLGGKERSLWTSLTSEGRETQMKSRKVLPSRSVIGPRSLGLPTHQQVMLPVGGEPEYLMLKVSERYIGALT